jgi:hypothetical protein
MFKATLNKEATDFSERLQNLGICQNRLRHVPEGSIAVKAYSFLSLLADSFIAGTVDRMYL